MKRVFASAAAVALLSACGPFIPVISVKDLPPAKRTALSAVRLYEPVELARLAHEVVGEVTGNSCRNLLWEPAPSREDAVNQLRYWAIERGANGLTEIRCAEPDGASLVTNCWESITCSAKAVRVGPAR